MRKYTTPKAEKVEFEYKQQVLASSGSGCMTKYEDEGPTATGCEHQKPVKTYLL